VVGLQRAPHSPLNPDGGRWNVGPPAHPLPPGAWNQLEAVGKRKSWAKGGTFGGWRGEARARQEQARQGN